MRDEGVEQSGAARVDEQAVRRHNLSLVHRLVVEGDNRATSATKALGRLARIAEEAIDSLRGQGLTLDTVSRRRLAASGR